MDIVSKGQEPEQAEQAEFTHPLITRQPPLDQNRIMGVFTTLLIYYFSEVGAKYNVCETTKRSLNIWRG